jgi:hypothetical protein
MSQTSCQESSSRELAGTDWSGPYGRLPTVHLAADRKYHIAHVRRAFFTADHTFVRRDSCVAFSTVCIPFRQPVFVVLRAHGSYLLFWRWVWSIVGFKPCVVRGMNSIQFFVWLERFIGMEWMLISHR